MVLPLYDDNPFKLPVKPVVTWLLILANVLMFLVEAGGSAAAAYLHLARTVCRRAERVMVALKDKPGESVTAAAIKYVNRLSDFFFVAARFANHKGSSDVLWVPGQNR